MNRKNHKISEQVLDNGLKILCYSYSSVPSATFMVWYKCGTRNEKEGKFGISHFLEHLSFKRTELFGNGDIISQIVRNGGNYNAYTSRDYTCYYETFMTEKLELAMIIESQRMSKLVLNENDMKTEVGIILSELEKSLNNPYAKIEEAVRLEAYRKHPYRNPIIGYSQDIKSITISDLLKYYENFYSPNNATIAVAGNFNEKEVLELIKKYFGNIGFHKPAIFVDEESSQNRLRRVKVSENGSYSIIKYAYHLPPCTHDDIFPLIVLEEMLNTGISSRLYKTLVEPQIVTDISANTEIMKDNGLFTLTATLYPGVSHEKAEEEIFKQIYELSVSKPPTIEELESTKKRIGSAFEFNKDGTLKQAYLLGYYETINSYQFLENYVNNIRNVTCEDVVKVTNKYLNKDNCTIGHFIPHKTEKKSFSSLIDYKNPVLSPENEKINEAKYKDASLLSLKPDISQFIIKDKVSSHKVNFEKYITSNGIQILVSKNNTSDTVKLSGTIYAGNLFAGQYIDKNKINPSLPFLCGGLINKGTKNRSKFEIAEQIESKGATVGISNVSEAINFSLSCVKEDFSFIFQALAEILTEPAFAQEEFDKMKKFHIAGIKQRKNNPDFIANVNFRRMIFPKSHPWFPFSQQIQEKYINNTDLNDVKSFYNRFYCPNSTIMAVSGNIDPEEVFALAEKYFHGWQPKEIVYPQIKPVKLHEKYMEKTISLKNKTETKIVYGNYSNLQRNHPDYYKAMIMNFILGGSSPLTSRIGKKLREESGLVYSISSNFTALSIPGTWSVRFGIDEDYSDIALKTLKNEIHEFINNGITDKELEQAKSYTIGSWPLRFANNNGIAKTLLTSAFYNLGDDYINNYPQMISSVKKEEVEEAAKQYLHPDKASVVLVKGS